MIWARTLPVGAVLALGLAVVGCGGSAKLTTVSAGQAAGSGAGAPAPVTARGHHRRGDAAANGQANANGPAAANGQATANGQPTASANQSLSAPAKPPMSASAFTAAADQICSNYRHEVAPLGQGTTLAAQEQVYASLVNDAHAALSRLRALSPPAADAVEFARFVRKTSGAVNDFVAAQSRTRSTQESAGVQVEAQDFAAFQHVGKAASAAGSAARGLGLHVCGSAGSDWL